MARPQASAHHELTPYVRSGAVLLRAWHAIRRNAETSKTKSTRDEAQAFGRDLPANLRKLQKRLHEGYAFDKAYGATPPKGNGKAGKRPIVVAPLPDRIVQRAILDVLQTAKSMVGIQDVLSTPTSIGGIPGRGVDSAIAMFDEHVANGKCHLAGSDIASFFTKIPKPLVVEFIRREGADSEFVDLFERALTVELSNAADLPPEDLSLFPTDELGVAQGCPLSALAGNIVLRDFDKELNAADRGLICIRYIDDFLVLGRRRLNVEKGMEKARSMLEQLGMGIYDPALHPRKAFAGHVSGGHDFLGYKLIPGKYRPTDAAQQRLRDSIDQLIHSGQATIAKVKKGRRLTAYDRTFSETLVAIDRTTMGWKSSFQSATCPTTFESLDRWIARRVRDFEQFLNCSAPPGSSLRVQALGVARMGSSA